MTAPATQNTNPDAPLALDFDTIWRVAEGGTRTRAYNETLLALCQLAATAVALGDTYGVKDALKLIETLTDRGHYYNLVL